MRLLPHLTLPEQMILRLTSKKIFAKIHIDPKQESQVIYYYWSIRFIAPHLYGQVMLIRIPSTKEWFSVGYYHDAIYRDIRELDFRFMLKDFSQTDFVLCSYVNVPTGVTESKSFSTQVCIGQCDVPVCAALMYHSASTMTFVHITLQNMKRALGSLTKAEYNAKCFQWMDAAKAWQKEFFRR